MMQVQAPDIIYYEKHVRFGKTFVHCWAKTTYGMHFLLWVREIDEAA